MELPYHLVAGLDVHKKSVVVVVLAKAQPEQDYTSGTFGTTQFGLKELAVFWRTTGSLMSPWNQQLNIGGPCG